MPTTPSTINYYIAADGTLRDGQAGSIAQTPRIYYGTEYAVTLSFPPSTIVEGDQLQVAVNRSRTFFSSASATGDAPVAAVAKHEVTAAEADAQTVTLTLSTNTRAMIDQVNGIDHPVRGFFGVHVLRGQSFISLAVADAFMLSVESGPDAISPPLPILDYPTRQEMNDAVMAAQNSASAAKTSEDNADASANAAARDAQAAGQSATNAGNSATLAESYAVGGTGTRPGEDTDNAKYYLEQLGQHETNARAAADEAAAWAEGTPQQVAPYGGENSAKGYATAAADSATSANTAAGNAAGSAGAASSDATAAANAKTAAETAQGKAETAQGKAEDAQTAAETAQGKAEDAQEAAETAQEAAVSAKDAAQTAQSNAEKIAEGTDEEVASLGLEHSAKGWAEEASERMTVITIPAATTSYSLQDNKHYQHKPDSVPTYTLPAVTMDGLVHEITILVDFINVTSCSFVDAGGVPVTLQSAISPQIGEAYVFRCYWYGKWRVVPLKIRNAATATSTTGVVQVSDAVAGDALALKMTAPRSVVVNQWMQNSNSISFDVDNSSGTSPSYAYVSSGNLRVDRGICKTGHVLATYLDVTWTSSDTCKFYFSEWQNSIPAFNPTDNKFQKWTYNGSENNGFVTLRVALAAGKHVSGTITMMFFDLTQYFNGDSTLINSIQSWDDLVAYDSRFAQYVQYNTGEVKGVTPTVKVTGKNLFDKNAEIHAGYLSENNVVVSSNNYYYTDYIPVAGGTDIVCSYPSTAGSYPSLCFYDIDKHFMYGVKHGNGMLTTKQYAVPDGCCFIRDSYKAVDKSTFQIELGSTATSYEPYHDGGTAQAPAPLFAVGNAADEFEAVSGVVTGKMASVDLGTLDWVKTTSGMFYAIISDMKNVSNDSVVGNIICKQFLATTYNYVYSHRAESQEPVYNVMSIASLNGRLYLNADYSDATTFKTAMSGVMLYYERATPTTSTSTPTQISLQAGDNVAMQTDGGRTLEELSMTYENLPANE